MTKEEYETKFAKNTKITGYGVDVTQHMPCPACAEPDFLVHKIIDTKDAYRKGAVCQHCGFGCKAIIKEDRGGVEFEFVQTHGGPIPDFLPPIRREGMTDGQHREGNKHVN